MKSLTNNTGNNSSTSPNNNNNNNNNNWLLGFSLSPHMTSTTMENNNGDHHSQTHQTSPSFYPYNPAFCYGFENTNAPYYSHLSSMPLKSDGSLCIMEALSRSDEPTINQQGMVPSPPPKLEDFLGGTQNQYSTGTTEREAMGLTLDNSSMYYDHQETEHHHQIPFLQPLHQDISHMLVPHEMYHGSVIEDPMSYKNNWSSMGYGDLHSLSLSMSSNSNSSCVTGMQNGVNVNQNNSSEYNVVLDGSRKRGGSEKGGTKQPVHRKSIDTFGQRTSQYRGVTRHRWTGRYEAHLWDNSCKKEGQTRKGRQVYLGGYDMEEKAARAYDLAALKYWGPSTHINFPLEDYQGELEEMKNMTRQEYVAHLRRKSSGFSRGASIYRGVTRHHQHGRWQARIGRVSGNKDLYLGTFSTQEEAAEAYDIAAIKFRGLNAVTNFDITRYNVEKIMASNTLLPGEQARREKNKDLPCKNPLPEPNNTQTLSLPCNNNESSDKNGQKMITGLNPSPCNNVGSEVSLSENGEETGQENGGLAMLFTKPISKVIDPNHLSQWMPPVQARQAVSIAHLPVFAAWTDA